MYTIGINAAYHDSAACLVRDGILLAAAEDERFTHVKHAKRPVPFSTWELPYHAIDYCLREAGIALSDVDHLAYSYDPYLLLGERRPGAAWLIRPTRPCCSGSGGRRRRSACRSSRAPIPSRPSGKPPGIRSSSRRSSTRRGNWPTGRRITCANGSPGSAPTAPSAGT